MMLGKCCSQYTNKFGRLSRGHRTGKKLVFTPIAKKCSTKEYSNYYTIAVISHASKIMFKILQARLHQYMSQELSDVQTGFRKDIGTRDQIVNICWIIDKNKRIPEKYLFLLH